MRRWARWLAVPLACSGLGCASHAALPKLIADKHYREALCAAQDTDEQQEVADALAKDANLQLHIHRITQTELAKVIPSENATAIGKRAQLLRIKLQTNGLPVDNHRVSLHIDGPEMDGARVRVAIAPVNWKSLAYATEETLPPSVLRPSYLTGENILKGVGAVFSFGFSLLFTKPFRTRNRAVNAPRSEYQRLAPIATALNDVLGGRRCGAFGAAKRQAKKCVYFVVVKGPQSPSWTLKVEQQFTSKRVTGQGRHDEQLCLGTSRKRVLLGPSDGGIQRVFGPRMQPLNRLAE